ncbi:MAG: MOSC N-terminal beta barrel domain-containing protein [Pseudomonadota bacterium]
MNSARVKQLFTYPVKSLRGIAVDRAELTEQGFRWDRHWMIINQNGRFISQRQFPKMVLIHTQLSDINLILSTAGLPDLVIPLDYPNDSPEEQATYSKATIWKDHCEVVDQGQAAAEWLTRAIATPNTIRLVRMRQGSRRAQSKPEQLGADTHTLFADAAPFLITNTASLDALNGKMQTRGYDTVTMERFRPNIVIEGPQAFAEHQIQSLACANYRFKQCYPCQRCVIPTIDINSGIRHPQQQPFSIIAELNPMPDNPKAPAFGENAILASGSGHTMHIGDVLALDNSQTT